jgi:hypothetical protein
LKRFDQKIVRPAFAAHLTETGDQPRGRDGHRKSPVSIAAPIAPEAAEPSIAAGSSTGGTTAASCHRSL